MYFNHPLIKENTIERREYQLEAARKVIDANTLIVLPTGTGKTIIALIATVYWLEKYPGAKIIFMAPTKPLIAQHEKTYKVSLKIDEKEIVVLSGEINPERRKYLWRRRIIFATPQVVYNDLIRGFVKIENNWMFIFDEAHRAVGNYAYVKIVDYINAIGKNIRITALTASPGDKEKTLMIMQSLNIKNIFILTEEDKEVGEYFYGYLLEHALIEGDLSYYYLLDIVKKYLHRKVDEYNNLIFKDELKLVKNKITYTYVDNIRGRIDNEYLNGDIDKRLWKRLKKILYQILVVDRLLSYVETYSYTLALNYLDEIRAKSQRKGGIAEKEIINSLEINEAYLLLKKFYEKGYTHPKLSKLIHIVKEEIYERAIIFVSVKNVALEIKEKLLSYGIKSELLIGQKRKNEIGLTQKKQVNILYRFKTGEDFKVLIATHIGEEGLDIGEVDLVIFYDTPISAIRRIQRRGRTGRRRRGKIYFLIMKKTREEVKYWAGVKRERRLYQELKELRALDGYSSIKKIDEYIEDKIEDFGSNIYIYIDHRERGGDIINLLKRKGCRIQLSSLNVGDYQVGDYIVERKTMKDFIDSIIDGRLFKQVKRLKEIQGLNTILVIEGSIKDFLSRGDLSTYIGAVISLVLDYNLKTYISSGARETAELIYSLYKRVSGGKRKTIRIRLNKKPYEIHEIQRFVLAGIPGIDNVLAERILNYFKNIKNVAEASPNELMKVKGVGPELAERIYKVFRQEFYSNSFRRSR